MRKVILVTGSAKGIGASLIEKFAKNNYDVVINYNKSEDEARKLQNKISKYNINSLLIKADITNELEVKNMIERILNKFNRIDIVINNAALALDNPIYDKTKEEFMRVLEVNVFGTFLVTKLSSKHMCNGLIINISSTDAVDTYNELSIDYCASKAAVNSLTKTMSMALPNVRIASIMLPWVNTEAIKEMDPNYLKNELLRTNQKRLLEVDEVSDRIYNLVDILKDKDIIRIEE